ncbi:MAG: hypothetical protein U9R34_00650 [Nanoarchaeota archaeon]|nr:hypothetical protein [Nanoarchaeota archaeon]
MAWMEFFRFSKFKYIANGLIILLLQFHYYNIAQTLRYCPIAAKPCFSVLGTLLIFNIIKILPIIIAFYLLTCIFEFLYKLFNQ